MRPPGLVDLSELSQDDVVAYAPFRPDFDALAARGVQTCDDLPKAAGAIVFVPRAKALARDLIARAIGAVPDGAPVIVDGDKTNGIESILKDCRKRGQVGEVFSKAHGKSFTLYAGPGFDDWRGSDAVVDGWRTRPGIFSADGVDPGSAALAERLPVLKGRICDLGAGWGYLAAKVLAASPDVTCLDLIEAEADALDCARLNVPDPRAQFHWADATKWEGAYDTVICNPPFHSGRKADEDLGRAFLASAARILTPRGSAWIVANRQLGYETTLRDRFAEVLIHHEGSVYKVIEAKRPKGRRG
jgi:16S rRNA (guanine1207-N2)-methyltransferase